MKEQTLHYNFNLHKEIFTFVKGKSRKLAEIFFLAENKPGVLSKITKVLGDNKINILSGFLTVKPLEEHGYNFFFIDYTEVKDENELNRVIEEIKAIEGVLHVELKLSATPGIIFDEITFPIVVRGKRMVPMSMEHFALALKRLYDLFSDAAAVMIHEIGKAYGEDLAKWALREFREFEFSKEQIIKIMARYGKSAGWCKISILEYNENEGKIEDSFECGAFKKARKPIGHFVRGVIAGFLSSLFEEPWFVREIKCIAKGDDVCIFHANKKPFI